MRNRMTNGSESQSKAAAPGPHPDGGPARLGYATPEFSMRRDPHAKLCDDAAAAVEIEAVLIAWGEGRGVELSDGAWLRRSVFGPDEAGRTVPAGCLDRRTTAHGALESA